MEMKGPYNEEFNEDEELEEQFNEEFHDYSSDSDMSPSDDENKHKVNDAKDKKKRGLTRLPKMRRAYTNSSGKKHKVKFDAFVRLSGKYRLEFMSFLGDLVREKVIVNVLTWKEASKELRDKLWEESTRYYEVDEDKRKVVMTRLGLQLRSFRSRVYKWDIHPNLGKPEKLAKIPRRFRLIILNQDHWDSFVAYTHSDKFKDSSELRREARSKLRYNHRLGRGGYADLEDKMLANNEVEKDVPPSRCLMWYKARQNKDDEIEDEELKRSQSNYWKMKKNQR